MEVNHDGTDLEAKDSYGLTPLHRAVRFAEFDSARYDTVQTLIQQGARVDTQSYSGRTPTQEAARYVDSTIYDLLIASGVTSHVARAPRDPRWASLRAFMSRVYWQSPSVTMGMWMEASAVLSNLLCTPVQGDARDIGILYHNIKDRIAEHVLETQSAAENMATAEMARFVAEQGEKFKRASKVLNHSLDDFNRHYIRRQVDEGRNDAFTIAELHERGWEGMMSKLGRSIAAGPEDHEEAGTTA